MGTTLAIFQSLYCNIIIALCKDGISTVSGQVITSMTPFFTGRLSHDKRPFFAGAYTENTV